MSNSSAWALSGKKRWCCIKTWDESEQPVSPSYLVTRHISLQHDVMHGHAASALRRSCSLLIHVLHVFFARNSILLGSHLCCTPFVYPIYRLIVARFSVTPASTLTTTLRHTTPSVPHLHPTLCLYPISPYRHLRRSPTTVSMTSPNSTT